MSADAWNTLAGVVLGAALVWSGMALALWQQSKK